MEKIKNVGGQAVIEGVMMRAAKKYSVAIRRSNGNILIDEGKVSSITDKCKFLKIYVLRGAVAFIESLIIGMKTLLLSADYFDEDENEESQEEKKTIVEEKKQGESNQPLIVFTSVLISLVLTVLVFFMFPAFFAGLFFDNIEPANRIWYNSIEGATRIGIFLLYIVLVSKMKDIRRVFEYHGAEHKTINCYEQDKELTVANVRLESRYNPRCGTNFIFIVMIISIIVFAFFKSENIWIAMAQRLVLLPLIAGVSYEIIKLMAKFKNCFTRVLAAPGMWFQRFTTREPDDKQIEVAIVALKTAIETESEERHDDK